MPGPCPFTLAVLLAAAAVRCGAEDGPARCISSFFGEGRDRVRACWTGGAWTGGASTGGRHGTPPLPKCSGSDTPTKFRALEFIRVADYGNTASLLVRCAACHPNPANNDTRTIKRGGPAGYGTACPPTPSRTPSIRVTEPGGTVGYSVAGRFTDTNTVRYQPAQPAASTRTGTTQQVTPDPEVTPKPPAAWGVGSPLLGVAVLLTAAASLLVVRRRRDCGDHGGDSRSAVAFVGRRGRGMFWVKDILREVRHGKVVGLVLGVALLGQTVVATGDNPHFCDGYSWSVRCDLLIPKLDPGMIKGIYSSKDRHWSRKTPDGNTDKGNDYTTDEVVCCDKGTVHLLCTLCTCMLSYITSSFLIFSHLLLYFM